MPRERDEGRLSDRDRAGHMLAAARDGAAFVAGRSRAELDHDAMLRRALINCLQEIGEAAAKIGADGRDRVPGLPWRKIIGMRHILVHVYHDLDHDAIWKVATTQLDPMIVELEGALRGWPA